MPQEFIVKMLDLMQPFSARNWLKTIRSLMQHAIATGSFSIEHNDDDPAPVLGLDARLTGSILAKHEEILGNDDRDFVRGSIRPCLINRDARSASPKSARFPQRLYLYRRRCRDLDDVDPDELLQSLQ